MGMRNEILRRRIRAMRMDAARSIHSDSSPAQ